jgi:hypothetical protein
MTWAWVIVGLIQGQSVQLSTLALILPGDAKAAERLARIRRWLKNPAVEALLRTHHSPVPDRLA